MYNSPTNSLEQTSPGNPQYPLRPVARAGAFRINVLKSLKLHSVTALLVTLLIIGLGLAVIAKHKATYRAGASLYVSPTPIKTLVEDRELDRPYDSFVSETIHDITDYDTLARAIRKMPPGLWSYPGEPERTAVYRLKGSLDVSRIPNTYQVEVGIEGPRPEHLAEIVNILTATYLAKARSDQFPDRDDRLATLKEERNRIQNDRDALLQEQDQITKALGVAAFSKGSNLFDSQNAQVQADLLAAHQKRVQAEAELAALTNGDPSSSTSALNAAADDIIASDPSLGALKSNLSQKRADLSNKLANQTAENPERLQTENQLAQIEKALNDMQSDLRKKAAARIQAKYRSQLNSAIMVESRLQNDLLRGTAAANSAAPKIQRAEEIQADLDRLQTRSSAVDERISNLELESSSPGSIHLYSPAMTPVTPIKSKITMLIIALFPIAILAGVLTAVALDLLDPHIYNASDVEGVLGFAPIGMLFDDRAVTQIIYDECALRLAAGVDHASRLGNARNFLITGVNSGAGTTTIIESLGSMLAKLGRKTLVIDPSGNSEPVAFVTFGAEMEKQPVDFTDELPLKPAKSTELQTASPLNSSLPTRVSPLNGFVLESFQALSAGYDIVLIDASPILISAESEYLARMADVTILVVEAGKTKKPTLTRAARLLERLGVAGAAAVINKVHPDRTEEAVKSDIREFELRSDKVNLQDWWKPTGKRTIREQEDARHATGKTSTDEQEVLFARDR